jgi:hypothetical protein
MSVFSNASIQRPYLAQGLNGATAPTLTGGGGASSVTASRIFYNQNISQIHIKFRSYTNTVAPLLLRVTLVNYPIAAAPIFQIPNGYCDLMIPITTGVTRPSAIMSLYSVFSGNNLSATPIDGITYNGVQVSGAVDLEGNTIPNFGNGAIYTSNSIVFIPQNFRIIIQNMDATNSFQPNNLEFYFVNR